MMRGLGLFAGALVLGGGVAFGGMRVFQPVHITVNSDGSGFAVGNLGDTRASADSVSYIGCLSYATPTSTIGECQARDNLGHSIWCTFNGADMLRTAAMINSTSRIQLAWNASNGCTMLQVENMSFSPPIAP